MTAGHEKTTESPITFERDIASHMRLQEKVMHDLRSKSELERFEEIILDATESGLISNAGMILRMKANVEETIPDPFPNFAVEHDGITLFLTTPATTPDETPHVIPIAINSIDPDHQQYLPPASEELVIKGLKDAEKEQRISNYALRHDDDESNWLRFQAASKNINERLIAVIKAKSLDQLPDIEIYIHEEIQKLTFTLPAEAEGGRALDLTVKNSTLEQLEPKIWEYLIKLI